MRQGHLRLLPVPCLSGVAPSEETLIAEQDRYGLPIETHLCPQTGLMWSSPEWDGPSMEIFYRDFYRALYRGREDAEDAFLEEQSIHGAHILRGLRSMPGVVFDIGCGAGGVLLPFQRAGWRTFGCDFGEKYLARGQSEGLNLLVGDAEVLRPHGPADLVIASHVLEHTPDPLAALALWVSLLRDGGEMHIEVPGIFAAFEDYRNFGRFLHVAHTYHFTLENLGELAAQVGLERIVGNERVVARFRKVGSGRPARPNPALASRVRAFIERGESPVGRIWNRIRRPVVKLRRKVFQGS